MLYTECEDLIRHMLVVEPSRRLSMRDIVCHRWMALAGEDQQFDCLVQQSLDTLDNDNDNCLNELVLHHMKQLGIDREKTVEVMKDDSVYDLLPFHLSPSVRADAVFGR